MKFTNKDIFEKILEPMGLKIGDRIEIEGCCYNPHIITEDYKLKIKNGNNYNALTNLTSKEFHKLARTKEQIHEELKRMAGDWKPDWEDKDKEKWIIIWNEYNEKTDCIYEYVIKHANTVYFKTREEAEEAIKAFTDEEWKTYFEVE